jgi:hypothetical protein
MCMQKIEPLIRKPGSRQHRTCARADATYLFIIDLLLRDKAIVL